MNHQHFMRPFLKRALTWAFAESKRRQVMQCAVDALTTQKMSYLERGLMLQQRVVTESSSGEERGYELQQNASAGAANL